MIFIGCYDSSTIRARVQLGRFQRETFKRHSIAIHHGAAFGELGIQQHPPSLALSRGEAHTQLRTSQLLSLNLQSASLMAFEPISCTSSPCRLYCIERFASPRCPPDALLACMLEHLTKCCFLHSAQLNGASQQPLLPSPLPANTSVRRPHDSD